jgi:hypothetical protein
MTVLLEGVSTLLKLILSLFGVNHLLPLEGVQYVSLKTEYIVSSCP